MPALVVAGSSTEPARHASSDRSLAEPMQRHSNEKSTPRSSCTIDERSNLSRSSIGEGPRFQKGSHGIIAGGSYLFNPTVSPATGAGMSSGGFLAGMNISAENGSKNTLELGEQQAPEVTTAGAPNGQPVQSSTDRMESISSGSDRQGNPLSTTTFPIKNRHRRAQSASSPQTPPTAQLANLEPSRTDHNRLSSPPIYDSSSLIPIVPPSPKHPGATRLQHRHTLQVPKLTTSRNSRDFQFSNSNASEDAISSGVSPSTALRRGSLNLVRRATRSVHSEMYMDDVPQDADAARWAERIQQKRMSRRRRKEEEEDDRVMVGTKVDQNHVNWVTAYNMLTGIRFTVSRTNAKLDRDLTDADFDARHKFSFDITGNELTPSAKYDFKFKDYAPWVFRHLRARFHLDPADYLISLTSKYILSELGSPGKSGSFFYFSRDYKFIIKTIHQSEHKLLRKVLREYYAHVEHNPNTLISQFYGLHRVKIPYGRKIHFVVMNNLFPPHRDIHHTFDLKGSTIGRDFKEEELERNPRATLKDLNWLRRNYHLEFGDVKKQLFIEQVRRDVHLLQKLGIMDYSLLVGIHDLGRGNEENLRDKTLKVFQPGGDAAEDSSQPTGLLSRSPSKQEKARKARELRQMIKRERPVPMDQSMFHMPEQLLESRKNFVFYSDDGGFQATHGDGSPGEEIYYLGIIDCLTHYGFVKKLETFWKGLSHNKSQISPVPPDAYAERFAKFISGITMPREEADRQASQSMERQGTGTLVRRPGLSSQQGSSDRVVEKAERQAAKTDRDGAAEEDVPDRKITTARSPSAERSNGNAGTTLPILEEVGESGSVGGHSARSGRSGVSSRSRGRLQEIQSEMRLPDGSTMLSPHIGGRPPPTPPKEASRGADGTPSLPKPSFGDMELRFDPLND